jgi:hypothetical protein
VFVVLQHQFTVLQYVRTNRKPEHTIVQKVPTFQLTEYLLDLMKNLECPKKTARPSKPGVE